MLEKSPPRGRPFAKGNPGRRPGSKNRSTILVGKFLEEKAESYLQKADEHVEAGSVQVLKIFLERMLPRERTPSFQLPPIEHPEDAIEAHSQIAQAVANGEITPKEAADYATIVDCWVRTLDAVETKRVLDDLKSELRQRRII